MARTPDPADAEFVRRVREPRAKSAEPGRHRARRNAMMLLYQSDLVGGDGDAAIAAFEAENDTVLAPYARTLIEGVVTRQDELDRLLDERLDDWSIERLGAVERAILRIAMFELVSGGDVPGPVAIDEAVELAKRYATPEAAKLINGVLGAWLREHGGDQG